MSDNEEQFNPKAHKNLLQAISNLGKVQHIRRTTRNEPQLQQDEFQLVKKTSALTKSEDLARNTVGIGDIVRTLRTTKKHLDIGKELRNVQTNKKVLGKPLEKPVADRMKRTLAYENVQEKLARWDAVVAKNRSAETQVFPLRSETIYVNTSAYARPMQLSIKSDLMREMEETEAKLKALKRERTGDTTDEKTLEQREQELLKQKLTRDELIAKRKELKYLKIRESQKSARARLKNKIKSKKYHKLLKRQKLQEQIKEFELLQKTNPEAALEKLNALEKSRVLERASLRHKNTGSWAKNLQIRAKYDKDVRKDLAEQLQLSREITQKKDVSEDSDESEDEQRGKSDRKNIEDDAMNDPFNPWTKAENKTGTADRETGAKEDENWRKYWMQRNENDKLLEDYKNEILKYEKAQSTNGEKDEVYQSNAEEVEIREKKKTLKVKLKMQKKQKEESSKIKGKTVSSVEPKMENGWTVEELEPSTKEAKRNDEDIDDIFDQQEDAINQKLNKKMERLSKIAAEQAKLKERVKKKKMKKKISQDALKNLRNLSFKNELKRPIIDEELTHDKENNEETDLAKQLESPLESNAVKVNGQPEFERPASTSTIDPTKIATVKLKQNLNSFTGVNDAIAGDVDVDDSNLEDPRSAQQMTISEAFEDDDIVADFTKDKSKNSELKDVEIELSMPGWGSWAGAGISKEESEQRNKRLVLKLAKEEKRRDDNKDGLYINEEPSKRLRTHLVSDVPFPFTSVQEYEASIRAPIGRNSVPETAFRMLTRPSVITQKGQIIEPMDESELVKRDRKLRNVVDRRIARLADRIKVEGGK